MVTGKAISYSSLMPFATKVATTSPTNKPVCSSDLNRYPRFFHTSFPFTVLALVVGAAISLSAAEREQPLPSFAAESLDGKNFSSTELQGKVALIDFWATWCRPCIREIPFYNQLQQRYGTQGLIVLGVTVQSGWPTDIRPKVREYEIQYKVLIGNDEIEKVLGRIWGFPTTFLVTRDGLIHKKFVGQHPGKQTEMESEIKSLLAKRD